MVERVPDGWQSGAHHYAEVEVLDVKPIVPVERQYGMTDFVRNRYNDKIRAGQTWADNDPRSEGRTIRIESVNDQYAQCEVLTAVGGGVPKVRRVRLLIDRLHPIKTGYRLISDQEA